LRIQIEPSEIFLMVNGVRCRVWNGVTEDDKQVFVFVAALASHEDMKPLLENDVVIEADEKTRQN
jgi:hypothetical protein